MYKCYFLVQQLHQNDPDSHYNGALLFAYKNLTRLIQHVLTIIVKIILFDSLLICCKSKLWL